MDAGVGVKTVDHKSWDGLRMRSLFVSPEKQMDHHRRSQLPCLTPGALQDLPLTRIQHRCHYFSAGTRFIDIRRSHHRIAVPRNSDSKKKSSTDRNWLQL